MKKPRSDKKLAGLAPERREQLAQWLLGGMGYETAVVRVREEWQLATSVGALSGFWTEECVPRLLARRARAAEAAAGIVAEAAAANPRLDDALRATLKQRAFETLIDPNGDPSAIQMVVSQAMALAKIEAGDRDRELKAQQLALDEKRFQRETCELFVKWAADDKARGIVGSAASNAEKIEQLGQLMFGEGWK